MAKITKRTEDYSQWYVDVTLGAEMADYAPVKGCMVIRPWGYAVWERMQRALDDMFKATGHENAYFPLLIPESFLAREAEHIKGFSPQCAIVTHGGGKELEERLVIRPTSETIVWAMYKKWIHSWRDLPLLYNQWANIVRWEMRTRLFLRTTEFLWQEGHTAHATAEEALEEATRMLEVYRTFTEQWMAMPVLVGKKTEREKFAGAVTTYAIEALMQDNRGLQVGTSHYLGQNFAKAFDVQFQNADGALEYVYATSWGVSTRLVGGLIMTHGDDDGLVLPPRLAPIQAVIIPILKSGVDSSSILSAAQKVADSLSDNVRVKVDDRDNLSPGWKFNEYELRGVPLRIELGPRDLKNNQVVLVRRDTREKAPIAQSELPARVSVLLDEIQGNLLAKAKKRLEDNTHIIDDYETFKEQIDTPGGFFHAHWCGSDDCEQAVSEETKATIRLIPLEPVSEKGACMRCGKASPHRVVFAKAY